MNSLNINDDKFSSYKQKQIVKYFQICLDDMYSVGKKMIKSDDVFIMTNISIYNQIYTAEFEGLFYKNLSENPFKNYRINIKTSKDGFNKLDYF